MARGIGAIFFPPRQSKQSVLRSLRMLYEVFSYAQRAGVMALESRHFFVSGDPTPTNAGVRLLKTLAAQLSRTPNSLVIEGHSDTRPFRKRTPRRFMAIETWLRTARIRPGGGCTFMAYDPTRWWKCADSPTAARCSPAIPMTPQPPRVPGSKV
jgi:hypothetical protein